MQVYKVGFVNIAAAPLVSKLKGSLAIGQTLWLIPGGSNIPLAVEVMRRLDDSLTQNLTIALTDERFVPKGHPDSNWQQLLDNGFDPKKARTIEVLQDDKSIEDCTSRYDQLLTEALEDNDATIGQFGMGEDGHIAGILPHSVAASETTSTVIGYNAGEFNRITVSFNGIRKLQTAFLIAFGTNKYEQLDKLIHQNLPLSVQPAQVIKQVNVSYIYNDQVEVA